METQQPSLNCSPLAVRGEQASGSPARLVIIHRLPDPSSRDSDLVGLGPGLRMRISDEFPGDADAALSRDRA